MGSWQPERLLYRGGAWRWLSFELLAGLTHRIDKPDCQFTNAVGLAQFDGFLGDQVGADADRGGAGQNEVGDVELVDASGGDQWHLWKRRLERFDIRCASELGAGENFDEVGTGFPRHHHLGWGESAGENDDLLLVGELDDLEIEPGGGEKRGARIQTTAGGFHIPDRAGADGQLGSVLDQVRDHFDGTGHGQGDFDDGNSAAGDRLGGK